MGTQRKPLTKIIVILGPTASGKTSLAIKLAKKFNGEIISADSRQVYREMNIGTAKPSLSELKEVPHHLINVVSIGEEFNVALFKELAIKKIKKIAKRKKIPFLVGGTGLYIWAVVDNLIFPHIPPNKKLRKELEKMSPKELFQIYQSLDPVGANFIERENKRRLIRAIEVCKLSKKPFWKQRKKGPLLFKSLQIGISLKKEELEKRIRKRTRMMIEMGLEQEARFLFKKYGSVSLLQTIGYQEWLDYFRGKIDKKEVKEQIVRHTLQYAKRQMTWFKKDKRIIWITNYQEAENVVVKFLGQKTDQNFTG